MFCIKCKKEIPDRSIFCNLCGAKQELKEITKKTKSRGNGQGTVYKLPNGKWRATVTIGYDSNLKRKTKSKSFNKKTDALNYLPSLRCIDTHSNKNMSFIACYDKMMERHAEKISDSTADCYKYAIKYFKDIHYIPISEIITDHMQQCVDNCNKGSRTKENMKSAASLIFKYALKNNLAEKNYAEYIDLGKTEHTKREHFSKEEINKIYKAAGIVPYADYILCLIFTGFRPNEMFNLKKEDYHGTYFIGGSKTNAGKDRIIPIANVIMPFVQLIIENNNSEYIFCNKSGTKMDLSHFRTEYYYPALKKIGIRSLPPYSCRHTFATLLKDINAPSTDKQKLMGHASFEMTAYYTHTDIDSLTRITDELKA